MRRVDYWDLIGGGSIVLAGAGAIYHSLTAFKSAPLSSSKSAWDSLFPPSLGPGRK